MKFVKEVLCNLAASEDQLPIPDWHRQVLAEDEARYQANPTEGSPWPEVRDRLRRR